MTDKSILLNVNNGIATLTLNRPEKKNAFTIDMIDLWASALENWRNDPQVHVIVLTGSGNDFCSGIDFSSFGAQEKLGPYEVKNLLWEKIHRIPLILQDIDKPVIAVMRGLAIGAGLDIALMCDMRFAADDAVFSEGYVKVGFVPGDGGAYYLPRLVGIAKALELLWTGDNVDANEALRIGMINRVYPSEKLQEETYRFAKRLVNGPNAVIRMIKRATYQSSRMDLSSALDMISSHMGVILESKDSREALMATAMRFSKKKNTDG